MHVFRDYTNMYTLRFNMELMGILAYGCERLCSLVEFKITCTSGLVEDATEPDTLFFLKHLNVFLNPSLYLDPLNIYNNALTLLFTKNIFAQITSTIGLLFKADPAI